jgi:hypothetical protein
MKLRAVTSCPAWGGRASLGFAHVVVVATGVSTSACHSAPDTTKRSAVEDAVPPADALVADVQADEVIVGLLIEPA